MKCNYCKLGSERERIGSERRLCFYSVLAADMAIEVISVNGFLHTLKYVMKYRHHEKPWCVSVLLSVINGSSGVVEWCLCIITILAGPLLPHQGEEKKLLMLDLKHNVFSLSVTGADSFICFPLPPDETLI